MENLKSFTNCSWRYKVIFLVGITLFCSQKKLISQITFSERYTYGFSTQIRMIMLNETGYLCIAEANDTIGDIYAPMLVVQFNEYGQEVSTSAFGSDNFEFQFEPTYDNDARLNDSTLVVMVEKYYAEIDTQFACLFWLNEHGDTLQTRKYYSPYYNANQSLTNWHRPQAIAVSNDGQYIYYAAQVIAPPGMDNTFVIRKLTAQGDVVWTYLNPVGNGYLCFALDYYNGQVWFHKLTTVNRIFSLNDETGEIDFEQTIESQPLELYRTDDLIVDETGMACASIEPGDPGMEKPAVFKVNFDGTYQWYKIPDGAEFGAFQDNEHIVKASDGGYVSCSSKYDEIPSIENPEDPADNNTNERIWLWKVDSEGTLLWQRFYEYYSFDSTTYYRLHNIAHDMKATPDGGYIMAGEATANCSDYPTCNNFTQQGWLLKVDDCGCLVPGCDTGCTVGVEEQDSGCHAYEGQHLFIVGPNPAKDMLNIYIPPRVPQPPMGANAQNSTSTFDLSLWDIRYSSFVIHDLNSNMIRIFQLKYDDTTYMIDTTSLAGGEYILSLVSEGHVLQTERIVVLK